MKSKRTKDNSLIQKTINFLGSNKFFYFVVVLFLVQAIWFAVSAAFPMMYDEFHHANAVQFFTNNRNPFNLVQTDANTEIFGELSRSVSYFYYFVMSFFNLLITSISKSFYVQIVFLRVINVLIVLLGILVFRRVFRKLGITNSVANVATLVFISLPIFPYIAAHINYDNLLFLMTSLFILFGVEIVIDKKINAISLTTFAAIGFLACIVKSSFLPIMVFGFVYIFICVIYRYSKKRNKALYSFKKINKIPLILSSLFLILSFGLFTERYVKNYFVYGSYNPKCEVLQNKAACDNQPVIKRDTEFIKKQQENPNDIKNSIEYLVDNWMPLMVKSITTNIVAYRWNSFEVREPISKTNVYSAHTPSFLVAALWLLLIASILFIAYSFREISRFPAFWFICSLVVPYSIILFLTNYSSFQTMGVSLAIQSRYLIIFLPLYIAYSMMSIRIAVKSKLIKASFMVLCLYALSQGGGMITYLISSEPNWYWQSERISNFNIGLRDAIKPYILSSETLHPESRAKNTTK